MLSWDRGPSWRTTLLLSAASAALYANSLWCDFAFDDATAVKGNRDLRPHVPVANLFSHDFWGTPMSKCVSRIYVDIILFLLLLLLSLLLK